MEDLGILHIQVLSFGVLILAAHFMGKITYHLNFGELIGQMLGGVLVNPYLLKVVHVGGIEYTLAFRNFYFFTFIFLSVVSFSLGEELHFEKLKDVGRKAVIVCFIQILTTLTLVTGGFLLVGFDPYNALIIGSIGLATSHAATFVITNKLKLEGELQDVLANIIVLDDLIEVILFSLVVTFAIGKQKGRDVSMFEAAVHTLHEVGLAVLLGILTFLVLKFVIREIEHLDGEDREPPNAAIKFVWNVFREHPSQSVQVMFVVVGLLSISVSIAMKFHLPFILVPIVTGACVSNFHSQKLFDSLKMEEISSFFNLMFFALIGANIHINTLHSETLGFVILYILTRTVGKLSGTYGGTHISKQDRKIRHCLPRLMLPQAGVAAVEAAYVAIVLKNGEAVSNVILPSLIFFEVVGVIMSEKTLTQWKSWTVGEDEIMRRAVEHKPVAQAPGGIQISSLLSAQLTRIPLVSTTKEGVILELLELLGQDGKISDTQHVFQDIMSRENLMTTGIGDGIAIPHGKTAGTDHVVCAFGIKPEGVDFNSLDGQPADIFFLIVSPEDDPGIHLNILSAISGILQTEENRKRIRAFSSSQDAIAFFTMIDESAQT